MHFGLYLVKCGSITAEQFHQTLEYQLASRPQLGALAIELGALTVREVFQVLRSQANDPKELFGELAINAGMLSEDELASLLYRQSTRARPMANIVVERGFATVDIVQSRLSAYRSSTRARDGLQNSLAS